MAAITSNLTIEQGATYSKGWLVRYNEAPIGADWTARGQIRAKHSSGSVLYDLAPTVDAATTTVDGIVYRAVVFAVSPATSTAWTWTTGVYDVEVVGPGGTPVLRVAEGRVIVKPEVTR